MLKSGKLYGFCLFGVLFLVLFYLKYDFGVKDSIMPIDPIATAYNGLEYAGSQTCISCHEAIYIEHLKTPHYNTSQLANKENVIGDFTENEKLKLNANIFFKMTDDDKLYQSAFEYGKLVRKEPFDIVIGSGTKGQSYLYWNKSKLYQLPISYWNESENWILSPGYSNYRINFDRAVMPSCLECHTTFAKNHLPNDFGSNKFVKKEIIFGVDCESCHGPSLQHVNVHVNNPELEIAQHISDIKTLSQQQQLDACAKCHSGSRRPSRVPFTFKTGDTLNDFWRPNYMSLENPETLDVHGNQYGLLTASQCFKKSEGLNCSTCHNPHKNERNQLKQFSQKCMGCHQGSGIHKFDLKNQMKTNCIDCHMPLLSSSSLTIEALDVKGKTKSDSLKVRTHKIGVYNDISNRIYKSMNQ